MYFGLLKFKGRKVEREWRYRKRDGGREGRIEVER